MAGWALTGIFSWSCFLIFLIETSVSPTSSRDVSWSHVSYD